MNKTIVLSTLVVLAACGNGAPLPVEREKILFVGCEAPIEAAGGRRITYFSHDESRDRDGSLYGLYFDVSDPALAPAIAGNPSTSYRALPISTGGVELVRRNARDPKQPELYIGMTEADQRAIGRAVFGGRPVKFDAENDFGRILGPDILPTDNLVFLEDGWVIGVIVPDEKIVLAQAFRASARAALETLLAARSGCGDDKPSFAPVAKASP